MFLCTCSIPGVCVCVLGGVNCNSWAISPSSLWLSLLRAGLLAHPVEEWVRVLKADLAFCPLSYRPYHPVLLSALPGSLWSKLPHKASSTHLFPSPSPSPTTPPPSSIYLFIYLPICCVLYHPLPPHSFILPSSLFRSVTFSNKFLLHQMSIRSPTQPETWSWYEATHEEKKQKNKAKWNLDFF